MKSRVKSFAITLIAIFASACGGADPATNPNGGNGKTDGVGTTHSLEMNVVKSVELSEGSSHSSKATIDSHTSSTVTVSGDEILFSAASGRNVLAKLSGDDSMSFVLEYRRVGEEKWNRLALGPQTSVHTGSAPAQRSYIFHKVIIAPAAGRVAVEWVTPGWWETTGTAEISVSDMFRGNTEFRIFVAPDWDFRRWDDGETRSYTLSLSNTIAQRFLF